jgi:hypothetical protein
MEMAENKIEETKKLKKDTPTYWRAKMAGSVQVLIPTE